MRLLALAALPLIALALAGCESESKAGTCGTVGSDVKTLEVHVGTKADGHTMYLTPATVTATQGEKVRLKVVNDDSSAFHDVALKNYNGETYEHEVEAGATVCTYHGGEPYFTATAKGSYVMYCEVSGHKEAGMQGSFVVN